MATNKCFRMSTNEKSSSIKSTDTQTHTHTRTLSSSSSVVTSNKCYLSAYFPDET